MPKIKKKKLSRQEKLKKLENKKIILKKSMSKSAIITYLLATIFLVISFLFNTNLLRGWVNLVENNIENTESPHILLIVDIIIKSLSIIIFFFFTFISIANWRELRGYIISWKETLILLVLALIQASINGTVFLISFLGIAIILTYIYFVQGRIEED